MPGSLLHIARPEEITSDEFTRRLRAFGILHLTIAGVEYAVTRVRESKPGRRLAFMTADGLALQPDRLLWLPVGFHRLATRAERLLDGRRRPRVEPSGLPIGPSVGSSADAAGTD